jgi:hypothetical protein
MRGLFFRLPTHKYSISGSNRLLSHPPGRHGGWGSLTANGWCRGITSAISLLNDKYVYNMLTISISYNMWENILLTGVSDFRLVIVINEFESPPIRSSALLAYHISHAYHTARLFSLPVGSLCRERIPRAFSSNTFTCHKLIFRRHSGSCQGSLMNR